MGYVRITKARPRPYWQGEAEELVERLIAFYMTQPGCLSQGTTGITRRGLLTKVGVWEDRQAADAAANQPTSLALRAELVQFCEDHPEEEEYDLVGGYLTRFPEMLAPRRSSSSELPREVGSPVAARPASESPPEHTCSAATALCQTL